MTDGVSITFELRLQPQAAEAFIAAGQAILQGTGDFPGFRHIRIVQHKDDPNRLLFIERWDSEEAYRRYIAWRTETGSTEALKQVAAETITTFWPRLIAETRSPDPIPETEGVSITLALTMKPQTLEPFIAAANNGFGPVTSFPGYRSIRLVQHKDEPTRLLYIERWDSEAAYKAYVDWQTEQGGIEQIRRMTTRMETNVWPRLVAYA